MEIAHLQTFCRSRMEVSQVKLNLCRWAGRFNEISKLCRNARICPLSPWPRSVPISEGSKSFGHLTGRFLNLRLPEKRENFIKAALEQLSTKQAEDTATVIPAVRICDKQLFIYEKIILSGIPDNVVLTSASGIGLDEGVFFGARFSESNSRHVTSLGTLKDVRFLSCFRFKLWWMAQKNGEMCERNSY